MNSVGAKAGDDEASRREEKPEEARGMGDTQAQKPETLQRLVLIFVSVMIPQKAVSLETAEKNVIVHAPYSCHVETNPLLCIVTLCSGVRAFKLPPPQTVHPRPSLRSPQKGFATFLLSLSPVTGSRNSFQLTGTIVFPASLFAMMTPSSFLAVDR